MEIGLCSGFVKNSDDLAAVRQLLEWGYRRIDYGYNAYASFYEGKDWKNHAEALKALMEEYGAKIHQIHGPWVRYLDEEKDVPKKLARIQRGIELCGVLECPIYVMHPVKFKIPEKYTLAEALEYNVQLFSSLIPLAKRNHVQIALENLYRYDETTRLGLKTGCNTAEELLQLLDRLDRSVFGICVDTGHALINQLDPAEMIEKIGKDLLTVHLHDNDQYTDAHLPMTYGKLDWLRIMQALRRVDYQGVFSMEVVARDERFAKEEAALLHELAEKLVSY